MINKHLNFTFIYVCVRVYSLTQRPEADFRSLGVEVTGICKGVEIWSSNRIVSAQSWLSHLLAPRRLI